MTRDLSPYSARRLLTQQLDGGKTVSPQTGRSRNASPSGRRSRSSSRAEKQRNASKDHAPRNPAVKSGAIAKREPSPEPYRKPRELSRSRERRRDTSRERNRDRSKDRRRDRSREKRRDRSGDRKRDGSRHRQRSRSRDRHRQRNRSRSKDKDRQRKNKAEDRLRSRSRSRDRHRQQNRSRSKDKDRQRKNKAEDRLRSRSRSRSPIPHRSRRLRSRSLSTSTSPPPKRRRRTHSKSRSRSPPRRKREKQPLPSQEVSFRGVDNSAQPPSKYGGAPPDKEKPNFKPTGALAKAANRVEGTKISLKYHEPAEARKPPPAQPWRIFVFKGDDVIDTIELWQKSCWLLGRAHEVVDYVLEHPSSSGQHAVIQFRHIQKTVEDEFGVKSTRGKVKPYIIDLESSNGTELNGEELEASRYFELRDKDIITFGGSEREYVVMLPPADSK